MQQDLAAMATQLKLNAQDFARKLAADQGVVESVGEKLGENLDLVINTRERVCDRGVSARSPTCYTLLLLVGRSLPLLRWCW